MKKIKLTLKKELDDFFLSEDGKIAKEDVMRAGVLVLGAATLIESAYGSYHPPPHNSHSNSFGQSTQCITSHSNHTSHTSHGSHGSHNSW